MTSILEKTALIAIDWGTSNFRAFLLDKDGNILETRFAKRGLLHVSKGDFSTALNQQIGDCLKMNPQIPLLMSGMVGSRQGWQEVPYLTCPLPLSSLATHIQKISNQVNTWIVPGLRIDYPDGRVDVMRGEETQILGCLDEQVQAPQVFCLPGTHSKWAWVENGSLTRFTTFMTGEIFNLLFKQSILGKIVKRRSFLNQDAFYKGLAWSERKEHLLSQLFQVRTQMLAGNLAIDSIHSFLSGLLIGHELSSVLTEKLEQKIFIVANSRVAQLYVKALEKYQLQGVAMNVEQVTTRGIFKVAKERGLV